MPHTSEIQPHSGKRKLKFTLALKLWLILFLSTTVLLAVLIAWFQFSVDRGFRNYIEQQHQAHVEALKPELELLYSSAGSWRFLLNNTRLWRQLNRMAWLEAVEDNLNRSKAADNLPPPPGMSPGPEPGPAPDSATFDRLGSPPPSFDSPRRTAREAGLGRRRTNDRVVLVDLDKNHLLGSTRIIEANPKWVALISKGQTIGYLGYAVPKHPQSTHEASFLQNQSENLLAIGVLGLVTSGVFAFLLAAFLVRPIRRLESSTKALTRGNYKTRIDRISNDELGSLALHFNELAATLEANEQSRRKWVADISHELRTPITFIKGQIEALIDGIRPTNTENLQSLEQQINQLSKLINELNALSQTELGGMSYKKQWLPVASLIDTSAKQASAAMAEKGLEFSNHNQVPNDFLLFIDQDRFAQLMSNLLANSLRHTDAPGRVQLRATSDESALTITLSDSHPGVRDEDLPKLFDRLYRTDHSRNSSTGGSGIGLAVCSNIVKAHDGSINVNHADLGGLNVMVKLPVRQQVEA